MLPSSILQFPFRSGLAEGIDPVSAPPGTLTVGQNIVWKKTNRAEKRLGTRQIPTTGKPTVGARLIVRGDELCVIDGSDLYSLEESLSKWRNVCDVPNVGITWSTLAAPLQGVQSADSAVSSTGLLVHAWVEGDPTSGAFGRLAVQVVEAETGAVLLAPLVLHLPVAAFGVRVLIIGTTAIVLTRTGAASPFLIRSYYVDLTALSSYSALSPPPSITLFTDLATAGGSAGWDACVVGSNFVVAYNRTGPLLALESYTAAGVAVASGSVVDANGAAMVSIHGTAGESLYILYAQATATPRRPRIAINHPTTLAAVVAPVTIEVPPAGSTPRFMGVCRYDATNCVVAYTMTTGTNERRMTSFLVTNAGVVSALTQRGTWWSNLTSRPFMIDSRCYAIVTDASTVPSTESFAFNSALVELEFTSNLGLNGNVTQVPHRYIAKIEALIAGFGPVSAPLASASTYEGKVYVTAPFQAVAMAATTNWMQGSRLVVLSTASLPLDMWRSVTVGQEAYVAGGLSAYDGRILFDYGFARAPFIFSLTTAGAGNIAAGTYIYAAVQEYRSNAGILHRSPVMVPRAQLAGALATNTLVMSGFNVTRKQSLEAGFPTSSDPVPSRISVYRTIVNGTTPQRLSFEPTYNVVAQDALLSTATLADTRADASIDGLGTTLASRDAVYNAGGELDDEQPPANVTMFYSADRLWVLAGNELDWWYSKAFKDNIGVAPGFNPELRYIFTERQVAGGSMDEKTVFFSARSIWFLQGRGPAPDGTGTDFQGPFSVQTDSGCTNARSLVSMPDGIMFEGSGDIFLLNRGLEVEWIGKPVQDQLRAYPVITSAVLLTKRNEIRFSCNASDGETGIVLVYNYVEKQWSFFVYTGETLGGDPVASTAIVDAVLWQDKYTFLTPLGFVYQESDDTYLDDGTWVTMDVETAEIFAEGPLSYQRVRRVYLHGQLSSPCDVTLRVATNGRTTYDQQRFFSSSRLSSLGSAKIGIHVKRQESHSIRFRITDAEPAVGVGSGQGINLSALGFEIAPIPNMDRRGAQAKR